MYLSLRACAAWCAFLLTLLSSMAAAESVLRYERPATKWSAECLPLGNGRLGCMVYGGVEKEQIQFNENSLWTGDANPSGDYKSMGAYQNFGSVVIELSGPATAAEAAAPSPAANVAGPGVLCASGHKAFYEREEVGMSADGDPKTKWCVEHKGTAVAWQATLPQAKAIAAYALVAANDTPGRDPASWELSASSDGREWTVLDRQKAQAPAEKRGGVRNYTFKNDKAFSIYRLTIAPNPGVPHLQVGEINIGQTLKAVAAPAAPEIKVEGYERSLSLDQATARVTFKKEGVTHTRTVFASHPEQVIVIHWSADKPGAVNGTLKLQGTHGETTKAQAGTLAFDGALKNGLTYEAKLAVVTRGGTVESADGALKLTGCDQVMIVLGAGTNYVLDAAKEFKGAHPRERVAEQVAKAVKFGFEELRERHVADFAKLYNRVKVAWGKTAPEVASLPTDKRLALAGEGKPDPELEQALFHYGRYLLIASSRRPGLPANLQGLWNDSNNPPWASDYHTNINIQMNYWGAESANMSECHLPLFDLVMAMLEPSRKATQAQFGKVRGWTARTSHNIFGGHGWKWNIPASAWYAQHFWEHYAFTKDEKFLKVIAYPMMKEVCDFWEDHLKKLPDGSLVVPNGWSPEHGPTEDGVAHDQQIVWDLFTNTIDAATALGVDDAYRAKLAGLRDKLVGPRIGKWGQMQEWMADRDDPKDQHRHTSHLFAVYPGKQISVAKTPEWAKAAKISLEARGTSGDSRREWAWAWRSAMWARLREPEKCYEMVQNLLKYNTLANLMGNHPPMQLDGNWGITAGMVEMMLQSHAGEIHLLPALPKAWGEGSFSGLRARGGFEVSASWKDGKVTQYRITSRVAQKVTVRVNDQVKEITSEIDPAGF